MKAPIFDGKAVKEKSEPCKWRYASFFPLSLSLFLFFTVFATLLLFFILTYPRQLAHSCTSVTTHARTHTYTRARRESRRRVEIIQVDREVGRYTRTHAHTPALAAVARMASSSQAASDSVVRACKAEIAELKEALHELALRDASHGTPGFTEVLEGKYLAQIKKARALSVQLGTAQQQLAEAQKALQNEREKTTRLVAAATAMSVGGSSGGGDGANEKRKGNAGCQRAPRRTAGTSNDIDDDEVGENSSAQASSSPALQRVYAQLHQRDLALAEVQRENAALRMLVKSEVGLRDDSAEVDALLARSGAAEGSGASASSGWRGRAEELVLLRSRLKDAQRRAEALEAAVLENGMQHGEENETEPADSLGLPASVRAYLGMADVASASEVRTTTTMMTAAAARRRDVDDDARDRLTTLQQQRAAQQRQTALTLEQQQRQLREEKTRTAALQARVATLKSELDVLRAYVDTILDKSSTDDELVEAYRAELLRAQEETRLWQKKAAAAEEEHKEKQHPAVVSGMRNAEGALAATAAAAAAVRSAPYRKDGHAVPDTAFASPPPPQSPPEPSTQRHDVASLSKSEATAYAWVLRAFQENANLQKGEDTAAAAAAAASPPTVAMAALLRTAMQHVAQVERSAIDNATAAAAAAGQDSGVGGAPLEKVLVKENTQLKKRIRALTEMMDREMQAQQVLWRSREAKAGVKGENQE